MAKGGRGMDNRILTLRVTPKASSNRVIEAPQPDGTMLYKIYVTTVPEAGKANAAVIALLAKHLGVAKSKLTLQRGATGKTKTVLQQV